MSTNSAPEPTHIADTVRIPRWVLQDLIVRRGYWKYHVKDTDGQCSECEDPWPCYIHKGIMALTGCGLDDDGETSVKSNWAEAPTQYDGSRGGAENSSITTHNDRGSDDGH